MSTPDDGLEVGDPVHYVARGSADGRFPPVCRAAIVTEVGAWETFASDVPPNPHPEDGDVRTLPQRYSSDTVGLAVLNPSGLFLHPSEMDGVPHDHAHDEDDDLAGPLCDGGWHRPGTWHHPPRRT